FQDSTQNYAASKRCTHLCYKLHNQPIAPSDAPLTQPMVKLEKTGTSNSIVSMTDEEKAHAAALLPEEQLNTLTPLERKWAMRTIIYMDPSTNRPESEEKAAVRWAFFRALEAATPHHRHKVYQPGDIHGLLEAVCGQKHYGVLATYRNLSTLFHKLHYNPRTGIDALIDQCRNVLKRARDEQRTTVHERRPRRRSAECADADRRQRLGTLSVEYTA
ncbi:MAG: hypothetical protein GY813_16980, partial [Halieaceae bacterium]|nr:hypothetical protein [Halieaceae bacterium]